MKIRAIKSHGGVKRFEHKYIGLNARLDTIQAAILNVKLNYFDLTIKKRNTCAEYYTNNLKDLENLKHIKLPYINKNKMSVWAQYSIIANSENTRDNIVKFLKENNVNAAIFYPAPLHTQECFQYLNYKIGDLPQTEKVCKTIFNLPCYAEISRENQDYVIDLIKKFFISE